MTEQDLEQVIREYFRNIYNADYIGKLKVEKKGNGILINIGMQVPEYPIIIYSELKGEALLKFIKEELYNRDLSPNNYGTLSLVYPNDCTNRNRRCCDTR